MCVCVCVRVLQVDGMGCEACQTHVKNVLDRSGGVIASSVDFTTGYAEVCSKSHADVCSKIKESKVSKRKQSFLLWTLSR